MGAGRDIREIVDCLLCGSADSAPMYDAIPDFDIYRHLREPYASMLFQHVKCAGCGTVYLRDRVRQEHIAVFYSGEYHCYRPFSARGPLIAAAAKMMARRRTKEIGAYLRDDLLLLDYGCGSGTWIREFQEVGAPWRMIGTDVVQEAVDKARAAGVEAYVANEDTLGDVVKPGSVGAVHMFHVIEHLPDPVGILRKLGACLADGGVVIGQTPNVGSWDTGVFGHSWNQWHGPRHLVLYTPQTLRAHAEAAGYDVVSITSTPMAASNWAGSVQKWFAMKTGRDYHPAEGAIYPLLMLGLSPLVALQSLISTTGSMDFVLRKRKDG
jgi:SAM-dependent methyltransferase